MKNNVIILLRIFVLILSPILLINIFCTPSPVNSPPVVNIIESPDGTICIDYASFSWVGSDPDGRVTGYYYSINNTTPDNWVTENSITISDLSEGNKIFYIVSEDDQGVLSEIDSCTFIVDFTVEFPQLYSPGNGWIMTDRTPHFDWNVVLCANSYCLQVSDDSGFSNLVINETDLPESQYTPTTDLGNGTYYWKVRARGMMGNLGSWNEPPWSFTINHSNE